MLSYLHAYHAGNHADILKHFVLKNVIEYMNQKEKPYTFFDTHSGSGLYRTDGEKALKTGEAREGIQKLLLKKNEAELSGDALSFISYLETYVIKNEYPGSPYIEADFLRNGDFLVLSELHPSEAENLKGNMKEKEKTAQCSIQVHKRNGFEMLKALTPPKTKRGCVLIDPSYEEPSDYSDVADAVTGMFRKWNGGVILVWYPLLSYRMDMIENMVERITEGVHLVSPNTDVNDFRLCVAEENSHRETTLEETETPRLFGSGMLVINTPWKLQEKMDENLPVFEKLLRS